MGPLANFKMPKGHVKTNVLKWIDEVDKSRVTLGKEALKDNDYANDLLRKKVVPQVNTHRNR